jgi:hypothetical protein
MYLNVRNNYEWPLLLTFPFYSFPIHHSSARDFCSMYNTAVRTWQQKTLSQKQTVERQWGLIPITITQRLSLANSYVKLHHSDALIGSKLTVITTTVFTGSWNHHRTEWREWTWGLWGYTSLSFLGALHYATYARLRTSLAYPNNVSRSALHGKGSGSKGTYR